MGKECIVEGDLDVILFILWGMEFEDGLIIEVEYIVVKKFIKEGRVCGFDGIFLDVFKYCDLYYFCFCE